MAYSLPQTGFFVTVNSRRCLLGYALRKNRVTDFLAERYELRSCGLHPDIELKRVESDITVCQILI